MNEAVRDWLWEQAGPIIRWRMALDWGYAADEPLDVLRERMLATDEVQRWLSNLGGSRIHGSKDTDVENALAKLAAYGLRQGMLALDQAVAPYLERLAASEEAEASSISGAPFLIALGYADDPAVQAWFNRRLEILHTVVKRGSYDLYLPEPEAQRVPKAWRGKPIYRDGFRRLPTCYDLYAMAHWPSPTPEQRRRMDDITGYIADPRFQDTPGGYVWDLELNRCYAAGRVVLAILNEPRTVLFLTLMAPFPAFRAQPWFQARYAALQACRTKDGTYRFPREYLAEKRNSYFIYGGSHQGLGENRRRRGWDEIESTFWALEIERLLADGG